MPKLAKELRVQTTADRGPGQPWRPGAPVPAAVDPDLPSADIRIGYARCSTPGQELDSQLDALAKHGIEREKIFSEKISTRIKVRPAVEEALKTAREIKAHAPHCRVLFTVYEMLEGLDAAARKGKYGGRPPVITDDMLHTVLRRKALGESVEQIQPDLIIPTGKRKGQSPSIYRALAEHEKTQAYPEAIEAAHADFAALQNADVPRPRPDATTLSSRP
ncbi:recombinase family protein [Streptomyces sp. G1]|uniref:recombinase family protein n=1 Tax=Streptomyces sp. G1 TaxID=361572 RepID=UPI00202F8EDA|nr:recombinase family protein [Streptomyces sp. G1]MCM1965302.1 recombinase family protein [Streptomyces sp. G1]